MTGLAKILWANLHQNGPDIEAHLTAFTRFNQGAFLDAVTGICDGIWADLDVQRSQDIERAAMSNQMIGEALLRREAIGKHTRLVTLNASIEVTRIGTVGQGIGVIAVEFKSLAVDIQALFAEAQHRIDDQVHERPARRASARLNTACPWHTAAIPHVAPGRKSCAPLQKCQPDPGERKKMS